MTATRSGKGKSLVVFPDEYVAIDLETTGTSPRWDKIIEIGAARVKEGKVVETFQELVNPGFPIGSFIEKLTGITDSMLAGACPIEEALPRFATFLHADDVMVGHNIACFDANFLYDAGDSVGVPMTNDFVDTMRIARKLHKDWKHHRLCDLREHFGITVDGAHRALADALATVQALDGMRSEAIDAYGSIDAFSEASRARTKSYGDRGSNFEAITPTVDEFDDSHPFYGKEVVITGTLPNMTRAEAAQQIVNCGGFFSDSLKKSTTNFLVVADYSNCTTIRGRYSGKHEKALKYKAEGADIEIIDADTFFEILNQ